nr:tyrosine-type recombinase/integrase [Deinococcus aestuarii]
MRATGQRDGDAAPQGHPPGCGQTVSGGDRQAPGCALSRTAVRVLGGWLETSAHYGPHVLPIRTRQGVEKALGRVCDQAGVRYQRREVHSLRHSAGTRTYAESGDLLAVRDTLRHRDVSSSQIYLDYAKAAKKVNRDR